MAGNVQFLDTNQFSETVRDISQAITKYNEIIGTVKSQTDRLRTSWEGEGETQFEKDYMTIYRQLNDISDILYELYNDIVDAQVAYLEADAATAKEIESAGTG